MRIRPANRADIPAIGGIIEQNKFSARWSAQLLAEELQKENSIFFVCEDKEIAGFILGRVNAQEFEIVNIGVSQSFLRQGAGTLLVKFALEKSAKRGAHCAFLEVNENNAPALKLYGKAGFIIVGARPKFYNNADTALLMKKEF